MRKNYITPEMTVKTFLNAVHTANENPFDTSALVMAKQYLNSRTDIKLQEVKVLEKTN